MREFAAGREGRPKTKVEKGQDLKYFKLYLNYLRPHKVALLLGFLAIPIITVVHLLQPVLIKIGIDRDIANSDLGSLKITALWFGLCVVIELVCRSLQSYLFQKTGIQSVTALRKDLFQHILKQSSTYYDKTPVGQLTTRVSSDIEALNETFSSGVITLLADILNILGIAGIMFYLSPRLTLYTLAFVPPILLMVNFFKKKLRTYYTSIRNSVSKLNSYLQEQLSGYDIVQLYLREEKNFKAFSQENNVYKKANMGSIAFDSLLYSIMDASSSIIIGLVIWFSFSNFIEGSITLGLLVAFIDYIRKFFQPLKELSSKFAILQAALAALEKIFNSFSIDTEIQAGDAIPKSTLQAVSFNKISFAYPGFEDKQILDNVSFDIQPNEVVAIVGPTGGGKSSISKLLSLLYTNYDGKIMYGDRELREFDLNGFRSQISIVTQDVEIFSNTVEFNISLGDPQISLEECKNAAKLVGIHQYLDELPQGYQTRLSSGSQGLSSGQAQLISFARALARNAPIVVLDEATAAVDSLSEKLIQEATKTILEKKTVLVIAHRLSTIQHANQIIALKNGRIVEKGNHQELLKKDGYYAKLFQMQFSHI